MIKLHHNILLEEEQQFLKDKCDNFIETHSPFVDGNRNRSYHKYKLDDTIELLDLQKRLLSFLKETIGADMEFAGFVINRVDNTTNQNDHYHIDNSDWTIVTYLNDEFVGGDFVYTLDNKEHTHIKVEKNLSIIMNKEIPHKITPITTGVRFSFACFFNYIPKIKNSLI
jgi:hypothetical protein